MDISRRSTLVYGCGGNATNTHDAPSSPRRRVNLTASCSGIEFRCAHARLSTEMFRVSFVSNA